MIFGYSEDGKMKRRKKERKEEGRIEGRKNEKFREDEGKECVKERRNG